MQKIVIFKEKNGCRYLPDVDAAFLKVLKDRLDDDWYDGKDKSLASDIAERQDVAAARAFLTQRSLQGFEYEDVKTIKIEAV